MIKKLKITAALLLVIAIILVGTGGCTLIPGGIAKTGQSTDVIKQAWDIITAGYVDPSRIDTANMTAAAIRGMIDTLHDPYTTYLTPEEFKMAQSSVSGEFEGIGAVVSIRDGNLVIISPFMGSPAETAGIKAGDIIRAINGEPTADMTVDVAVSKIRGPGGTTVVLTVLHPGETVPVEITVTRDKIEVPSVHFEIRDGMACISISQFTERTESEFAPVVQQVIDTKAQGIVLDLRGNPGGLLDIVIDVASHFIMQGIVVQVRSNQGVVEVENVKKGEVVTGLPMVVLVDEFSASGSEVLAGALQDHDRALISGNTTYGKGSVNYLHRLNDGSGIYLTSARWLTPNGRLIEGQGIEPDVKLELTGDDAISWAINYLKNGSQ
jgi:carboxyl-terminal processing protease